MKSFSRTGPCGRDNSSGALRHRKNRVCPSVGQLAWRGVLPGRTRKSASKYAAAQDIDVTRLVLTLIDPITWLGEASCQQGPLEIALEKE